MEIRAKDTNGIEHKLALETGTIFKDLVDAAGKAFNTDPQSMKFIHKGKILKDGQDDIETKYKIKSGDILLIMHKQNSQKIYKKELTNSTLDTEPLSSNPNSQHQIDTLNTEGNNSDDALNEDIPNLNDAPLIIVPRVEDYDPTYNHIMMNSVPIHNQSRYTFLIDPTKVEQLLNMGFDRDNIIECLRAANNNLEIAAEFCMNGIPRDDDEEEPEDNMEEEESENQMQMEGENVPQNEMVLNDIGIRPRNGFDPNANFHLPNINEDSMEDDITNLERAIFNINNTLSQQISGSSRLNAEEIHFLKDRTPEQRNEIKEFIKSEYFMKLREEVKEDPEKLNVFLNEVFEKEFPNIYAVYKDEEYPLNLFESQITEKEELEFKYKQESIIWYLNDRPTFGQNQNTNQTQNEDMIIEENNDQRESPVRQMTPATNNNQDLFDLIQRTFAPNNLRTSQQSANNVMHESNNEMSEEDLGVSQQNVTTQQFNVDANNSPQENSNQQQNISNTNLSNGDPRLYALDPRDNIAVQNQESLGFTYNQALEAYQSCNKNEELAANFLFDNPTFGM